MRMITFGLFVATALLKSTGFVKNMDAAYAKRCKEWEAGAAQRNAAAAANKARILKLREQRAWERQGRHKGHAVS